MKLKKLLVMVLACCLLLALSACKDKNNSDVPDAGGPGTTQSGTNDQNNQQGGSVDFGLQAAPDPDFDSPATGDDSGKLYTIVGDYAYELDPSTLQPVGEPLDPVTHQPVSNPVLDGTNPSTPNNPQDQTPSEPVTQPEEPEPVAEPEPVTQPEPEKDTSLPNTGMFLEDD